MDNNQNGDMLDKAKEGAKKLLSLASSPIKKYILAGVLSALPYVVIIVFGLVIIIAVFFGVSEQLDSIYETSGNISENIGERIGNAITLQGFKTNEEVNADEEVDYYKRLRFLETTMSLTNYDITLINNTVLYETNAEDRINLSNNDTFSSSAQQFFENINNIKDLDTGNGITDFFVKLVGIGGSIKQFAGSFFENIATRYAIGFVNSIAGSTQYEKANKSLFAVASAIQKCKDLTIDQGTEKDGTNMIVNMSDDFKTCYTGFLIAENSTIIDELAEKKDLSFVNPGELIFTNDKIKVEALNIMLDSIFGDLFLPINTLIRDKATIKFSISLSSLGCLSEKDDTCTSKVAGYNGYIYNNLQEYYKYDVSQGDNVENDVNYALNDDKITSINNLNDQDLEKLIERYKNEDKNKRAIASDIFERTDGYLDATYGQVEAVKNANYKPSKGETGYAVGTSCSSISNEDLVGFSNPTNSCQVNSCFGVYAGGMSCTSHKGVDVNAPTGVYSVCTGKVASARMYNDNSASAIEVDCEINGKVYRVRYLHMPMSDVNKFNVGDTIHLGDYMGQQGNEGWYTDENGNYRRVGTHLHLDVSLNGSYVNAEALVKNCTFTYKCEEARNSCGSSGQYYCK